MRAGQKSHIVLLQIINAHKFDLIYLFIFKYMFYVYLII